MPVHHVHQETVQLKVFYLLEQQRCNIKRKAMVVVGLESKLAVYEHFPKGTINHSYLPELFKSIPPKVILTSPPLWGSALCIKSGKISISKKILYLKFYTCYVSGMSAPQDSQIEKSNLKLCPHFNWGLEFHLICMHMYTSAYAYGLLWSHNMPKWSPYPFGIAMAKTCQGHAGILGHTTIVWMTFYAGELSRTRERHMCLKWDTYEGTAWCHFLLSKAYFKSSNYQWTCHLCPPSHF